MKKSLRIYISLFFSVFFIISIIACNNSAETKLVYTENDTIKQSVKEREQGITWTQELEKERLTTRITRSSMEIGSDVPYNKELFKISKTMQAPVYPDLNDFGSLDTRNIRATVKDKMNNFCSNLSLENHTGTASSSSTATPRATAPGRAGRTPTRTCRPRSWRPGPEPRSGSPRAPTSPRPGRTAPPRSRSRTAS